MVVRGKMRGGEGGVRKLKANRKKEEPLNMKRGRV